MNMSSSTSQPPIGFENRLVEYADVSLRSHPQP
jgi:hypothetical protein